MYGNGQSYEGQWKNDQKQNYGVYKDSKEQLIYKGEWAENQYHGRGWLFNYQINKEKTHKTIFDYKDFTNLDNRWLIYEGEFKNGLWDGIGTLTLANNQTYTGSFQNGRIDGSGTFQ